MSIQHNRDCDEKKRSWRVGFMGFVVLTVVMVLSAACQSPHKKWANAQGLRVNEHDENGLTLMHLAAGVPHSIPGHPGAPATLVEWLKSRGAEVNARDNAGRTPIFVAVEAGNWTTVWHLIAQGADVNARDDAGQTPIFTAVAQGTTSYNTAASIQLLFDHGAEVDTRDHAGRTPMFAAAGGTTPRLIMEYLLKFGADINARDHAGLTPLSVVQDEKLRTWMTEHGARE